MRSQVIEIASACYVPLHTPREIDTIVIQVTWRDGKAHLHIDDPAYGTLVHQLFHPEEVGETPAVIGHEAGNLGLGAHPIDTLTVEITAGQRFLHVHRFACLHAHDGVSGM